MPHGGGGVRKVPKKCHVLFEWPLRHQLQCKGIFTTCDKTRAKMLKYLPTSRDDVQKVWKIELTYKMDLRRGFVTQRRPRGDLCRWEVALDGSCPIPTQNWNCPPDRQTDLETGSTGFLICPQDPTKYKKDVEYLWNVRKSLILQEEVIQNCTIRKGKFKKDVTQCWTVFDSNPAPIPTVFKNNA